MAIFSSAALSRIDYRSTHGTVALLVLLTGFGVMLTSRLVGPDALPRWLDHDTLGAVGLAVMLLSIHNYFKSKAFNANGHSIVLYVDRMEFNRVQGYTGLIEVVRYADIQAIEVTRDEDDGGHVRIRTADFSHQFDGEDVHPPEALITVLAESLKVRAMNARYEDA